MDLRGNSINRSKIRSGCSVFLFTSTGKPTSGPTFRPISRLPYLRLLLDYSWAHAGRRNNTTIAHFFCALFFLSTPPLPRQSSSPEHPRPGSRNYSFQSRKGNLQRLGCGEWFGGGRLTEKKESPLREARENRSDRHTIQPSPMMDSIWNSSTRSPRLSMQPFMLPECWAYQETAWRTDNRRILRLTVKCQKDDRSTMGCRSRSLPPPPKCFGK